MDDLSNIGFWSIIFIAIAIAIVGAIVISHYFWSLISLSC